MSINAGFPPPSAEFVHSNNDDWVRDFYKECGREATLAYTTLNQMKNWAITVQGAIIAAVAAFSKGSAPSAGDAADLRLALPMAFGSVLAYVFTLRFFVRAILCYINLQRWNTLQSAILEWKLLPRDATSAATVGDDAERAAAVRRKIQDYYYRWRSPVNRAGLIASNLKLGFGMLLVVPPLLIVWSVALAWDNPLVQAFVVFAVGATLIEGADFFRSPFFDTAQTRERGDRNIFPAASSDADYIVQWVALGIFCSFVALRPFLAIVLQGP
jgi:hypothetical protein